jgi:hypothetical protein
MPAPVSPDAERLMELHEAVVTALRATYKARGDEAWLAACEDLGRAKAAFREALFATQPDAGAMAEADARCLEEAAAIADFVREYRKTEAADVAFLMTRILSAADREEKEAAIAQFRKQMLQVGHNEGWHAAATRREAAGFARGVEAVCKIADSMSLQWSRAGAQETARRLASAGRALLGEGKE